MKRHAIKRYQNYWVFVKGNHSVTGGCLPQSVSGSSVFSVLFAWPNCPNCKQHDDFIKWKHFPPYWSFVRVNSPHKGQWRGALMFSLIYAWINGWVNNREADGLRRHRDHYDVIIMKLLMIWKAMTLIWRQCSVTMFWQAWCAIEHCAMFSNWLMRNFKISHWPKFHAIFAWSSYICWYGKHIISNYAILPTRGILV